MLANAAHLRRHLRRGVVSHKQVGEGCGQPRRCLKGNMASPETQGLQFGCQMGANCDAQRPACRPQV